MGRGWACECQACAAPAWTRAPLGGLCQHRAKPKVTFWLANVSASQQGGTAHRAGSRKEAFFPVQLWKLCVQLWSSRNSRLVPSAGGVPGSPLDGYREPGPGGCLAPASELLGAGGRHAELWEAAICIACTELESQMMIGHWKMLYFWGQAFLLSLTNLAFDTVSSKPTKGRGEMQKK